MSRPNGHELRSAETRARLIDAAIEIFGEMGYEAASTRELANKGLVNMSAITYHFCGKRELYLAASEKIGDYAANLVAPLIEQLDKAPKDVLARQLETTAVGFLDIMLDEVTPNSWAMFLARCTAEHDEAFDRIYDRALAPLHRSMVRAAIALSNGTLNEDGVRLRTSSTIAAVISFRLLPGIVLRGMGWKQLQPKQTMQITAMVRELVRNGFLTGWTDANLATSPASAKPMKVRKPPLSART